MNEETKNLLKENWGYPLGFILCISILILFFSIYTDKIPYLSAHLHDPSFGFFKSIFLTVATIVLGILALLGIGIVLALLVAIIFFGANTMLLIYRYSKILKSNLKNKFNQPNKKSINEENVTQPNKKKEEPTLSNIYAF